MQRKGFDRILEQLAAASNATSEEVREKLRQAMALALENPDPAVQAMWDSIPKQGHSPTLEEFMEYLIAQNLLQP